MDEELKEYLEKILKKLDEINGSVQLVYTK
jgi:hypothetical protein